MKRILVCPLDWGLGHATRCIPIIRELLRQGAEVLLASAGDAGILLRNEFPSLRYFDLPSYDPSYPLDGSMSVKMLFQLPKFIRTVTAEHGVTEELVQKHLVDIVISDNRYGCYSVSAKSIFITHQPDIIMPEGWSSLAPMVNSLTHRYIKKFQEVWIPDLPSSGLTTAFGTGRVMGWKFIGWLSRFHPAKDVERKYDLIAIISGPEPQRGLFSENMLIQLKKSGLSSLLVAGEPGKYYHRKEGHVEIVNHLSSTELESAINASKIVISRSGYSTVMDLIVLGKKAIFVPTPQQPEQIILARQLSHEGVTLFEYQDKFDLEKALRRVDLFSGFSIYKAESGLLEKEILNLLA